MGVLKGFLFFCAGAFALAALLALAYVPWFLIKIIVAAVFAGLAYLVFVQAKKFGQQGEAGQQAQFEATFRRLAEKGGGRASLAALVNATGEDQQTVQHKMRELIGRGVCEMDFGDNGEQLFKLTPMDEARANLAKMSEKA